MGHKILIWGHPKSHEIAYKQSFKPDAWCLKGKKSKLAFEDLNDFEVMPEMLWNACCRM